MKLLIAIIALITLSCCSERVVFNPCVRDISICDSNTRFCDSLFELQSVRDLQKMKDMAK
jgi:hypothetical protein